MFDFAWSQIALIGVVALVFIGPKDMPIAIRAVTNTIKKARRMAAEFQTHVDEMMREADLKEVRDQISEIHNFDIKNEIEKAVDPDRTIRDTFTADPFNTSVETTPAAATQSTADSALEAAQTDGVPAAIPAEPTGPVAPAFIPPHLVVGSKPSEEEPEPPAFIPPDVAREQRMRAG